MQSLALQKAKAGRKTENPNWVFHINLESVITPTLT